ncbi:MAG: hypothetical protein ACT4OI_04220 [Methanobacteriota archaeon]
MNDAMFLTRAQRIGTGLVLVLYYGLLMIVILTAVGGWPTVILVVFWSGLVTYLGVRAFVRGRSPRPS